MKKLMIGLLGFSIVCLGYAQMRSAGEGDDKYSVILEPIYGGAVPVINPSGMTIGDTVTFMVQIFPTSIKNDAIKWKSNSSCISFVGSDRGRTVQVKGNYGGEAKLSITVEGYSPRLTNTPTISVKVFESTTMVKVFPYIIRDVYGGNAPITEEKIYTYFEDVNKIYKQAAMKFEIQPILYTNSWEYWRPYSTNERTQVRNLLQNTGGVELYFVDTFPDQETWLGATTSNGIILTRWANARVIAHELGHACGLKDIYHGTSNNTANVSRWRVKEEKIPNDWNSGPPEGRAFYPENLTYYLLLRRLLMYGYLNNEQADISTGQVYGFNKDGIIEFINVGLSGMNRNPVSN